MKCQHCGSNLNIEDNYCQNCGGPNPFAVKHQNEMDHYRKDYQKTKEEVLGRSEKLTKRNIKIAIIAVLVALIAVCCFILINADDIRYLRIENSIASNADDHEVILTDYLNNRDYLLLYSYINRNKIMYSDIFMKYEAVYYTTQQYSMICDDLVSLQLKQKHNAKFTYINESELLENIANHIYSFYKYMEPQEYNIEAYQGINKTYMDDLKEHLEFLISGCFGVAPEKLANMKSMTASRIGVLLEDIYNENKQ